MAAGLLQRDESGGVGSTDAGPAVLHGLKCKKIDINNTTSYFLMLCIRIRIRLDPQSFGCPGSVLVNETWIRTQEHGS